MYFIKVLYCATIYMLSEARYQQAGPKQGCMDLSEKGKLKTSPRQTRGGRGWKLER